MPSFPVAPGGDEFMSLIQASVTAATWKGYDGSSPVVLLVGHSYICRAALRAENRPGGKNLGFSGTRVIWRGVSGMRWLQVLPEVVRFSRAYDGPLVLVIHAGGNDLCQVRVAELISLIKSDMVRFPPFFMDLVIVWSELVPRLAWRGARNVAAVDRSRTLLNQRISRFVRSQGWVVVRHRQLETDTPLLADGVHLNEAGLDIFLSGLRDGVGRAISLLGGGRSSV
ncbi:uncharacterized protein LOC121398287 [Xenopus laevis]|uniref:Uncharacterized protein LOC121398287 n=1 Tax=Xenopus laevis TaxID=8355 RepID=A0A8J1LWZ5_XENLA|nr:uncharacterized protein LOC121398287 [Xenopus laevis]